MPDETLEQELRKLRLTLELAKARNAGLTNTISEIALLGEIMSAEVDRLTTEVSETTTAIDSVLVLLTGLATRLRAIAGDAVKVNDLANELDSKQKEIAAAVEANTVP